MPNDKGTMAKIWFVIAEIAMPIVTIIMIPLIGWLGATLLTFHDATRDNANSIQTNTTAMEVLGQRLDDAKELAAAAAQSLQSHLADEREAAAEFRQMKAIQTEMRSDQKEVKEAVNEIKMMLIRQEANRNREAP